VVATVAANTLLGLVVLLIVMHQWSSLQVETYGAAGLAVYCPSMLITGLILGIAQGLVLRRTLSRWRWWSWLGANELAGIVYGPVVLLLLSAVTEVDVSKWDASNMGAIAAAITGVVALLLVTAFPGAILGFAQSRALSRHFQAVRWWIGANVIGSILGICVALIVGGVLRHGNKLGFVQNPSDTWLAWMGGWVVYGLVVGAITGWALVKMARKSVSPIVSVDLAAAPQGAG